MMKAPWEVLNESHPNYPKRGCRYENTNLETACYDCVSKREQFCKIFTA